MERANFGALVLFLGLASRFSVEGAKTRSKNDHERFGFSIAAASPYRSGNASARTAPSHAL